MATMKKLSMAIAGAALSACCLGLEPAYAHPGHEEHSPSPLEQYQETPQNVLVVPPDASGRPAYYATGNLYTFLATGKETGGQFALVDGLVPPQAGAIPHVHSREDELFYILEGEITFQLEDQTVTATPGTSVYLPKGRPHGWGNAGNTQARTLALLFPAGFEGFFVDQNQPVIDRSAPIPPARDLETVVLPLTRKYGTQVVDPAGSSEIANTEGLLDYVVAQADTNRPSFNAGGGLYTYLTTSEETGEQFSLLDVLLPPQAGPQLLQSNAQAADSFYVLDGEVTFQIGDQTTVGTPGTFVYLPQNTSYAYQNRGTTQARTLLLRTATRVPEPSSWFSLLGFGAFVGANLVLKRKQKKQKSADLDTNTDTVCLMNN